jgi:hypothetical protein
MQMAVFWDVAPYSLVETDRRVLIALLTAVSTSETSVSYYETTRRNIPEDSHLKPFTQLIKYIK